MLALMGLQTPAALQLRRAAISVASRRGLVMSQEGGDRASAAVVRAEKAHGDEQVASLKQAMDLNPPRGTRDFYPDDMALRTWLFCKWRDVAGAHGFEEYDAPVLETEDLYIRKAGEDVTQQLYSMDDRSGRRLSLRPEMTPSLARMVLGKRNALPLPLKVSDCVRGYLHTTCDSCCTHAPRRRVRSCCTCHSCMRARPKQSAACAVAAFAVVLDPTVLEVRAHDARPAARALPVESRRVGRGRAHSGG